MIILHRKPHEALSSLVDFFYFMHIRQEKDATPIICPFPPTPLQFMVFYLDDLCVTNKEGEHKKQTRERAMIIGPQATKMNLIVKESHRCFVIGFQPGGLHRLLKIPMQQLYDDGFDGRLLIGRQMEILTEQLMAAKNFDEMILCAENYLLKKLSGLKEELPLDAALKVLTTNHGLVSVDKIASLACLSVRQFERKCLEQIGYSPKFFARLARFSKAYRLREALPQQSWTSIAYEAGYFDQMHLIRDFRQFAGVLPSVIDTQIKDNPYPMQGFLDDV